MKGVPNSLLGFAGVLVAGLGAVTLACAQEPIAGSELFGGDKVHQISLAIDSRDMARLRNSPRGTVNATVTAGTNQWKSVAVHLKGATGSFQTVDAKPSFTLTFETATPTPRFFGLRKVHLNNSVEDGSYLNEQLGGELFRRAGVSAARAGHGVVRLNGKRLGLYVIKEGFTEDFLTVHFGSPAGQIYEARHGHDIDEEMKPRIESPSAGKDPAKALVSAIRASDPEERWRRMGQALDLDEFVSFMAMEVLLGHGDGYCIRKNNFRIVQTPSERLAFVPHGMDQLFGRAPSTLYPRMNGLAARAVMEAPSGRDAYRARVGVLFANVFDPAPLIRSIDRNALMLGKELARSERRDFEREISVLKERILERHRLMREQLAADNPLKANVGKPLTSGFSGVH